MSNDEKKNDDELYEHHNIKVDKYQSLLRIDKFLIDKIPGTSRNKIQDGIQNGYVKVNEVVVKQNYKVKPLDKISVSFPAPPRNEEIIPEKIDINIKYEDEDLLIVNKKAGMVVHPSYNNWTGTLVNGLVYYFKNLPIMPKNNGRPGLVHRIDKETSGLLVVAKNEKSMISLAKQFFDHSIKRKYVALIWGEPKNKEGTIDINLGRSIKDRRVVCAYTKNDKGKKAITHYKVIESFYYVSIIECQLETGRTHQIRAHMKHIGHPIFNDKVYGGDKILKGTVFSKYKKFVENCFNIIPRQALHAKSLGFIHPRTKKKISFESSLPEDFGGVIAKWKKYTEGQKD